MLSMPVVGEVR